MRMEKEQRPGKDRYINKNVQDAETLICPACMPSVQLDI
jgi:hypothetical protein